MRKYFGINGFIGVWIVGYSYLIKLKDKKCYFSAF